VVRLSGSSEKRYDGRKIKAIKEEELRRPYKPEFGLRASESTENK
jgi:hypothetical protein